MAKPDNSANWASSDSALKQLVSAARQSLGWKLVEGTDKNPTGEKPPIKEWNGWMNAVGQWMDWIGNALPDNAGEFTTFTDWRPWYLGLVRDNASSVPYLTTIEYDTNGLSFKGNEGQPAETGNAWNDYKAEIYAGSRYLELKEFLTTGLSIRLIDGADVEWVVWAEFINENDMVMSGSVNAGTTTALKLVDPGSLAPGGLRIIKTDGGVITNPTDFSTFTALTSQTQFLDKNPGFIRVGMLGDVVPPQGIQATLIYGFPLRRKWIRPLVVSTTTAVANLASFPIEFRVGGRYRWSLHLAQPNPGFNGNMDMYAHESAQTDRVTSFSVTTSFFSTVMSGEFTYLGDPGTPGLSFNCNTNFATGPGHVTNNINSIYQISSMVNNYITIEELY